ncbi:hypothetical protein BaRGS_00002323 [Batillaria attramentaria]|uniref:Uncharacterized protein n=1 Tax=Batillaria attramentaria TaxID=370345 RepID=A0ABD0M3X2_9CAEN
MQSTKEVRGWLGVEPPAPRVQLDLSDEGYNQQPLTVLQQNALNAKMTLLTCQQPDSPSLYDHLSTMLTDVLDRKPSNAVDHLEKQSSVLKTSRMRTKVNFKHKRVNGQNSDIARKEWNLFKAIGRAMPNAEPEDAEPDLGPQEALLCLPNLMHQSHLFSSAGAGLPSHFYVRITLALRELAQAWPLISLRLWGVVHGLHADYTVAEELEQRSATTEMPSLELVHAFYLFQDAIIQSQSEEIKPLYKPPRKVPCEPAGVGLNRKVYFVCSQLGTPWVRLPHVTPAQIQAARKIRKFFTGARDTCVVDLDFDGVSMRDLHDPGMTSWVHHANYILPQGRTTWFNPLVPEYAVATVHSVIWPGALAVASDNGRFFENLYVGWGQKYLYDNFEPALPEFPLDEFPTGPEVIEADDPSPETEAAIRAAMREQEVAMGEDDDIEDGIIDDDEGGPDLSD